jgi:hypothetical protein
VQVFLYLVLLYSKDFVSLQKNNVMIHVEYLQKWIWQKKGERELFKNIADSINRVLSFRLLLPLLFVSLGLMSCSSDDGDEDIKRREFAQIVENRSAKDLLNDLYVGSDGDIQSLSRMLNVTPSSIERIRKGETEPTDKFDNRIKEVSIYYFQNEQSYSKLRSILDEEWSWYDSIWYFPSHRSKLFWGIVIGLILVILVCGMIEELESIALGALCFIFIVTALYIFIWILLFFVSPEDVEDKYKETIDPTIERVI